MKLYDVISKERGGTGMQDIVHQEPKPSGEHPELVPPKKFSWKKMAIIGGVFVILAAIYVLGVRVVHAKVTIFERRIPFSLEDERFELVRSDEGTAGRLSFQTMAITSTVTREVYGGELAPSTTSAKGKVVFFNEYSKSTQSIKAKSVLVATNGKRYQTTETVTVPGYTMNGKQKVAGTSAAVGIVATATGPSYNNPGTSFTVSGWSAVVSKQFYAQSVGAISGGDEGVAHLVADADKAQVVATLQAQLTERLKRETRTQIPDGFVTYPDLQFVTIDADSLILKGSSIRFPASIKGTMVTYLIPRDILQSAIAAHAIPDEKYPRVSIPSLGDLEASPVTAIPTGTAVTPATITISFTGQGTIITKAPLEGIKESLIGVSRKRFTQVLSGIPEVDTARFSLYPFWAPFFPSKESAITIVAK